VVTDIVPTLALTLTLALALVFALVLATASAGELYSISQAVSTGS
jgi:hypothetical protein